jgi:acetylornithine deacetylase/succinyl-diaminopimelate desuccinylase-like protein
MRCSWLAVATAAAMLSAPAAAQSTAQGKATASLFKDLLRFDTSNVPGDTTGLAAYLKTLFDTAGIDNEIVTAPNGKAAHFIARLKGDGSKRPVLLAAHADVVPADRATWSVDPFGGVEKDGYIWGRGALDNKGAVAAFARAMLRLKEARTPLKRDVIFMAEADEEQGPYGTLWLARDHWDKMDAEFVLNEGGEILMKNGKVQELTVSFAEKVSVSFKVKTSGKTSHSSRPLPVDVTANGQLISALEKLQRYATPITMTPEMRTYFSRLATLHPGPLGDAIGRMLAAPDPAAALQATDAMMAAGGQELALGGLVRNTMVVMMITGGFKANAMPTQAEALVNARLLPGTDVPAFLDELRAVIGNPQVELEVVSNLPKDQVFDYLRGRTSIKPSSLDTDLFRTIESNARAAWPQVTVLPTMLAGGTDATPWRQRGIPVYGIAPFPVDPGGRGGVHGADERVPTAGIDKGSDYIFRIVRDVATR